MSTTATYDNDDSCDSDSDGEKQPTAARLVQGSLILVMCVVNLGGNTLLWVTIIRFRRFHRGMYVFLLSMAASDSFLGAVNMPMLAYGMLVGRRTYGCTVCQVVGVTYPVCVCATITSVCAVSVNRYVRVCKQHWYPKVYQGCYTMFFHIAVWHLT
ncbi:melatonin receptor type 1B-A-like [Babylonia areolata]|uniref:melatonin receptor type 1B-A-like n=1 Tax=Babylonia areolata TaxID=304850 RepID=UPI003FD64FBA